MLQYLTFVSRGFDRAGESQLNRSRPLAFRFEDRIAPSRWKLLDDVLPDLYQFCAVLDQVVRSEAVGRGDVARDGVHVASLFDGEPGRNKGPASLGGFDDQDAMGEAGDDAVAERKILPGRRRPRGELGDEPAALDEPA